MTNLNPPRNGYFFLTDPTNGKVLRKATISKWELTPDRARIPTDGPVGEKINALVLMREWAETKTYTDPNGKTFPNIILPNYVVYEVTVGEWNNQTYPPTVDPEFAKGTRAIIGKYTNGKDYALIDGRFVEVYGDLNFYSPVHHWGVSLWSSRAWLADNAKVYNEGVKPLFSIQPPSMVNPIPPEFKLVSHVEIVGTTPLRSVALSWTFPYYTHRERTEAMLVEMKENGQPDSKYQEAAFVYGDNLVVRGLSPIKHYDFRISVIKGINKDISNVQTLLSTTLLANQPVNPPAVDPPAVDPNQPQRQKRAVVIEEIADKWIQVPVPPPQNVRVAVKGRLLTVIFDPDTANVPIHHHELRISYRAGTKFELIESIWLFGEKPRHNHKLPHSNKNFKVEVCAVNFLEVPSDWVAVIQS